MSSRTLLPGEPQRWRQESARFTIRNVDITNAPAQFETIADLGCEVDAYGRIRIQRAFTDAASDEQRAAGKDADGGSRSEDEPRSEKSTRHDCELFAQRNAATGSTAFADEGHSIAASVREHRHSQPQVQAELKRRVRRPEEFHISAQRGPRA